VNPGMYENCTNGIDDDCNGLTDGQDPLCAQDLWSYPFVQASVYGSGVEEGSAISNILAMLLLPMGAVLLLRKARRSARR
jgi:hypothetical protein